MTNIAEILKDCPKGTKLYSPICGECEFKGVYDTLVVVTYCSVTNNFVTKEMWVDVYGKHTKEGDCVLFPSKENRDWSTFNHIKEFRKGDFLKDSKGPEFKPFDKVLVRDFDDSKWIPALYGFKIEIPLPMHIVVGGGKWKLCIPYEGNEHLLGTNENCE